LPIRRQECGNIAAEPRMHHRADVPGTRINDDSAAGDAGCGGFDERDRDGTIAAAGDEQRRRFHVSQPVANVVPALGVDRRQHRGGIDVTFGASAEPDCRSREPTPRWRSENICQYAGASASLFNLLTELTEVTAAFVTEPARRGRNDQTADSVGMIDGKLQRDRTASRNTDDINRLGEQRLDRPRVHRGERWHRDPPRDRGGAIDDVDSTTSRAGERQMAESTKLAHPCQPGKYDQRRTFADDEARQAAGEIEHV
jgi:hypothetical protein